MRLHFAQTTSNNNRKRDAKSGRIISNPDQRFFLLVVEVEAITTSGMVLCVCAAASERVIVRAVNPGQFRPREISIDEHSQAEIGDLDQQLNLNSSPSLTLPVMPFDSPTNITNTIFQGNVGINTSNPDQALTVVGNVKLTGVMLQPSDIRVKENIEPV